jgi:hypothetical protein
MGTSRASRIHLGTGAARAANGSSSPSTLVETTRARGRSRTLLAFRWGFAAESALSVCVSSTLDRGARLDLAHRDAAALRRAAARPGEMIRGSARRRWQDHVCKGAPSPRSPNRTVELRATFHGNGDGTAFRPTVRPSRPLRLVVDDVGLQYESVTIQPSRKRRRTESRRSSSVKFLLHALAFDVIVVDRSDGCASRAEDLYLSSPGELRHGLKSPARVRLPRLSTAAFEMKDLRDEPLRRHVLDF